MEEVINKIREDVSKTGFRPQVENREKKLEKVLGELLDLHNYKIKKTTVRYEPSNIDCTPFDPTYYYSYEKKLMAEAELLLERR